MAVTNRKVAILRRLLCIISCKDYSEGNSRVEILPIVSSNTIVPYRRVHKAFSIVVDTERESKIAPGISSILG